MSSWWRLYAESLGATESSNGSWKKRVAAFHSALGKANSLGIGSYPKQLTRAVIASGTIGTAGVTHARLIAATDAELKSSGSEMLATYGARAPLDGS